jgi:hypothetical protein
LSPIIDAREGFDQLQGSKLAHTSLYGRAGATDALGNIAKGRPAQARLCCAVPGKGHIDRQSLRAELVAVSPQHIRRDPYDTANAPIAHAPCPLRRLLGRAALVAELLPLIACRRHGYSPFA